MHLYNLKVTRWELLAYYGAIDAWREDLEKDHVSPGRAGPVVAMGEGGRELRGIRWGWPPPNGVKGPVVNVRNYASPFWRSALVDPARRCLVPVTSFQEWSLEPDPTTGGRIGSMCHRVRSSPSRASGVPRRRGRCSRS